MFTLFCGDFCAIVAQKHQQNSNKCWAVCIIAAESACHCDEFDKSKFCNLPKNHLLECSRIEIFIPKYYTAFYKKAHTQTYRVLLFPTQAQMFAHRIIFSKKTVNTAQLVEKVRFRARCAQRIKSRRMARVPPIYRENTHI